MELRLQQFIESVENLADVRNLDEFNPIVFQMEHPVTATRYTVVGSKAEPSYLGIPVNTTWIVLDPQSEYYRMALKLVDTNDPDRATNLVPIGIDMDSDGTTNGPNDLTLYWNIIRTYDEIFSVPQYYVTGGKGPKGDKGDKGDPGEVDYNQAAARLAQLAGTLQIVGPSTVGENGQQQYTLSLSESEILPDGTVTAPQARVVVAPLFLIGQVPEGTYLDANNVLHVGALTANTTIRMHATYPTWGRSAVADLTINLQDVPLAVSSIVLNGPNAVNSGETAQYSVTVTWSDNTTSNVTGTWSLDSTNFGSINSNGLLSVPSNIASSGSVNVSCSVSINGTTYTPNKTVVVTKVNVATVQSVTVSGPTAVNSGNTAQYQLNVLWSDNTTTHPVGAWTLNSNAFGSIDSNGLLTVPNSIVSSGQVVVTGTVSINGTTYQPTLAVDVTKVVVVPTVTSVTITGSSNVASGSNTQYGLLVNWSNSTTTTPAADSWSLDVSGFGTIDANGLLSVPNNIAQSGVVTVNASVAINGTTYTPSKTVNVTLVDTANIAPFYGTGPALPSDWTAFVNGLTPFPALTVDGKYDVSIDCLGSSTFMYFAYPQSHGEATFYDKLSQFFGGWGGAGNSASGPSTQSIANFRDMPITQNITINGVQVPFYIYRTDFPNLGAAAQNQWEMTLATP